MNEFVEIFSRFLPLAVKTLQLKGLPDFEFLPTIDHDEQPTFGMYVNGQNKLYVAIANRHPNDILRTIAHELTHYKQDTEHQLNHDSGDTGSPEENEANAQAGIIMRHFNRMYPEYLKSKPIVVESATDESLKGMAAAGLIGLGMLGGPKDVSSGFLTPELQRAKQQAQIQKKNLKPQIKKTVAAKPLPAKAVPLVKVAKAKGIQGVELAQFLAQMEHESLDFNKMKEIGKATYFNKYDPKHNPRLASKLGNKYKGDGVTFKGRGFVQLTGRENYTQASYDIFGDNRLVKKPDLAAQPDIAARIAVWYWLDRVKPMVKDFSDTTRVTKIINGGLNGLEDREHNFREYMSSLGLKEDMNMARQNLVIFDIDDTLLHTTAKIKVINDRGQVVRTLTNQEFNNYVLQPGEQFDFGEFRDAEKFNKESKPIEPMMNRLKDVLANSPNAKAIMLTARADFDDKNKFLNTFKKYGIDMSRVHVHRAGNIPGDAIPAEKKAVWVRKYLNTGKYKAVWLYDDSRSNLSVFKDLKNEYPNVAFHAIYVGSKGETSRVEGR
jgi:putative chitinase